MKYAVRFGNEIEPGGRTKADAQMHLKNDGRTGSVILVTDLRASVNSAYRYGCRPEDRAFIQNAAEFLNRFGLNQEVA